MRNYISFVVITVSCLVLSGATWNTYGSASGIPCVIISAMAATGWCFFSKMYVLFKEMAYHARTSHEINTAMIKYIPTDKMSDVHDAIEEIIRINREGK